MHRGSERPVVPAVRRRGVGWPGRRARQLRQLQGLLIGETIQQLAAATRYACIFICFFRALKMTDGVYTVSSVRVMLGSGRADDFGWYPERTYKMQICLFLGRGSFLEVDKNATIGTYGTSLEKSLISFGGAGKSREICPQGGPQLLPPAILHTVLDCCSHRNEETRKGINTDCISQLVLMSSLEDSRVLGQTRSPQKNMCVRWSIVARSRCVRGTSYINAQSGCKSQFYLCLATLSARPGLRCLDIHRLIIWHARRAQRAIFV